MRVGWVDSAHNFRTDHFRELNRTDTRIVPALQRKKPKMKTTPKPLGDSRTAWNAAARISRATALLLVLILAAALLLGCTRDRPVEGNVATPGVGVGAAAIQLSTPPTSTPQPALSGEPNVAVSDTATLDGTPSPTVEGGSAAETIEEYIVASGDTLLSIAIDFGMSLEDLRALNFLDNDLISIGQPLRVRVTPPTPTATPEPFLYTVQAGDSLGGIAARFGIGMVDLMNANRLEDPNAIAVGRELIIPGAAPAASTAAGEAAAAPIDPSAALIHIVRSGESLSQIAQDYGVTASAIVSANRIANPNSVRVGTELTIPGISAAEWADRNAVRHTVAVGESLSQIAQQYGVTTAAIVAENGLSNPNAITVGQVLRIPQTQ